MFRDSFLIIGLLFTNAFCCLSQKDSILAELKKHGIHLIIDSSKTHSLKRGTSFFFYYNFQGFPMRLNVLSSGSKFTYNQTELILARKNSELDKKIREIDSIEIVNSITNQAKKIKDIRFIPKIGYSGKYTDQFLDAKDLSFLLYLNLFETDPEKDLYKASKKDSLVGIDWLSTVNLKNFKPLIVFESKEFISKHFDQITPVDLWYQRIILIDLSGYSILSDQLKSRRHISYYH